MSMTRNPLAPAPRAHGGYPVTRSLSLALLIAASLAPRGGLAVEYALLPTIGLQGVYNDNILLTTLPHQAVYGLIASPQIDIAAAAETWQIAGSGRLRSSRYSGGGDLDSDDKFYSFNSHLQQERNLWELTGSTAKESIALSEISDPDKGLVVDSRTHRTSRTLSPAWTRTLGERSVARLSYVSSDVHYDTGVHLQNYTNDDTGLYISYLVSERGKVFLTVDYADYQSPSIQYRSSTLSRMLGLTYNVSETFTATLSGGGRKTRSEQVVCFLNSCQLFPDISRVLSAKDSGSLYDIDLQQSFERTRLGFGGGRSIDPTGSGTQIQTDSWLFSVDQQLSPRLTASLHMSTYRSTEIGGTVGRYPDQQRFQTEPRIRWNWTERLVLEGSYLRTRIRYFESAGEPISDSIRLTLTYTLQRLALSR
jgi:hypothetical protein